MCEIIHASKRLHAPEEIIDGLEAAKKATLFINSIEILKPDVPECFFIQGQNPLTLLHHALNCGLLANSDADFLEAAVSIRVVLSELVERLSKATQGDGAR